MCVCVMHLGAVTVSLSEFFRIIEAEADASGRKTTS